MLDDEMTENTEKRALWHIFNLCDHPVLVLCISRIFRCKATLSSFMMDIIIDIYFYQIYEKKTKKMMDNKK